MFAYCLNNPVNFSDETGKSADSYAGVFGEILGELLYEWITGDDHPNSTTEAHENQIRQAQSKAFRNGIKKWWDAYVHSVELQAQAQYEQDMAVRDTIEYFVDQPLVAVDLITGVVGTGTTYYGMAAAIVGFNVPVAGQVALGVVGLACGIWGLSRLIASISEDS